MPLMNQIRGANAPIEIQNSMFRPFIKKALRKGIGGRRHNTSLLCYAPGAKFLLEVAAILLHFSVAIAPTLQIKSDPDEK